MFEIESFQSFSLSSVLNAGSAGNCVFLFIVHMIRVLVGTRHSVTRHLFFSMWSNNTDVNIMKINCHFSFEVAGFE